MRRLEGKVALVTGVAAGIGRAVLFLASDEASLVTGAPLIVDGGLLARL